MTRVAIALGSNLGDRAHYLREAAEALRQDISSLTLSTLHETVPVGVGDQPLFLNAAAVGCTTLAAPDLLAALLGVERQFGRERPHLGAPRTLDLDLILYGNEVVDTAALAVPHPRFRERRFVLAPLAEIAGEWCDPVTGRTIQELLNLLG